MMTDNVSVPPMTNDSLQDENLRIIWVRHGPLEAPPAQPATHSRASCGISPGDSGLCPVGLKNLQGWRLPSLSGSTQNTLQRKRLYY